MPVPVCMLVLSVYEVEFPLVSSIWGVKIAEYTDFKNKGLGRMRLSQG